MQCAYCKQRLGRKSVAAKMLKTFAALACSSPRRLLFAFLAKEISLPQLLFCLALKKPASHSFFLRFSRTFPEVVSLPATSLHQSFNELRRKVLDLLSLVEIRITKTTQRLLATLPNRSSTQSWSMMGALLHILGSFALSASAPSSITCSTSRLAKWRSTSMARVSAAITACWAVGSLLAGRQMRNDLMFNSTKSAKQLTAFSIGVHLAEAVDMVLQGQASKLLVHHLFVITCFTSALLTDRAVGFAVLSLVTEVNSVFNKTRIIHLVAGLPRRSNQFQRNAKINLATFVVRMMIVAWMNLQSFLYFNVLPLSFLLPCNLGLLFVNFWNVSVFKQLVFADLVAKAQTG